MKISRFNGRLVILCCPAPSDTSDGEHFINPNGLLWLASTLSDSGFRAVLLPPARAMEVIDLIAEQEEKVATPGPDTLEKVKDAVLGTSFTSVILGVTLLSSNRLEVWNLLAEVKKRFPRTVVFVGGPQVTAEPEEVAAQWPSVDYIVSGPGHMALPEAARLLFSGEGNTIPRLIDGWTWPKGDPSGEFHWPVSPVRNGHLYENIVTSLGCPGKCRYCSTGILWPGKLRFRNPGDVADEIEDLWKAGIRRLVFSDDTFTADPNRLRSIFKDLDSRGVRIAWDARTRADCIRPEDLDFMRAHGCCSLSVGIESADPAVLKGLGKKLDPGKALEAVRAASAAGIYTNLFFIVGGPGETERSIRADIDFISAARPGGVTSHILHFLPGTSLEREYGRRNWYDFSNYTRIFRFTAEQDEDSLMAWQEEIENAGRQWSRRPEGRELADLLAMYPDQFDLWVQSGDEAFDAEQPGNARISYEKAESLIPTPEVKFKIARTMTFLGKARESRKWLVSCVDQIDFLLAAGLRWNEKTFYLRAMAREGLKESEEEMAVDLRRSLGINPWYAPSLERMSYYMLNIEEDKIAAEYLDKVVEFERTQDWYYNYTVCMLNIEDIKNARMAIEKGLGIFPRDPALLALAREIRKTFGR